MSATTSLIASGPGWTARDIVCTAGPGDRSFEEQHEAVCIAVVTEGSFQYRSRLGSALLGPGALLLGNHSHCFECGHEHAAGDRCLSFHFTPEHFEQVVAAVPGARRASFDVPSLPPVPSLMPLLAEAEVARDLGDPHELEELALRLAGAVAAELAGAARHGPAPSRRDERRVTRALRRIEADAESAISLADLAEEAATSPYHFLRVFRTLIGMTPHQFLLRTRLTRAALRLRRSDEPISAIAFEVGFNDLSTFNHRFRRIMGASPSAFRKRARARRAAEA